MKNNIDKLIENTVRCTKCGAKYGECDCWVKCECGWNHYKTGKCNNPIHKTPYLDAFLEDKKP
jgi:DNA polymerase II large subunit